MLYICKKNDNTMAVASAKEQTAFRFDKDLLSTMKSRAKGMGKTLNGYVNHLIIQDLKSSMTLPEIFVSDDLDSDIERFAGIIPTPSETDLKNDERLAAIWNR